MKGSSGGSRRGLIKDAKWIDEDYIPQKLLFRDSHIENLDYIRRSVIDGKRSASDTLLLGAPGTGKTALLRDLLANTRSNLVRAPSTARKVKAAYLDCNFISNERTFWANLATELTVYHTSTTSLDQVRNSVLEFLKDKSLLLMLDEIDILSIEHPMVLDSTTNTLARTDGVIIVAAANRKDWKKDLGLKNTFSPRTLHLPEYNEKELQLICEDRIINGLFLSVVESGVVEILAKRAHRVGGDARKLIKMLKIAVEEAERRNREKITRDDAEYAVHEIDDESHYLSGSLVNKSHDSHLVLLAIYYLNSNQDDIEEEIYGVKSGNIVQKYTKLNKLSSFEEPLKYRSIMDLLQKLLNEGLIDRTRAKTRGNVWFYEINNVFNGEEIERSLKQICSNCKQLKT